MKPAALVCLPTLLLVFLGSSYSLPADKEKVEDGRYALLKNGAEVRGSEHRWTLWRLLDGRFDLEDHFEVDKTARPWFGVMLGMPTTPELRKSLQESVAPSDLEAILDPDRQLLSLTVRGVKLNGDKGVGLKCQTTAASIECTGTSDKAKLRFHEPRALFWWYGIPVLLQSWIASPQGSSSNKGPRKITVLSFGVAPKAGKNIQAGMWGDKPTLEPADLTLSSLGPATLVLGDRNISALKYALEVKTLKGDSLSLTVWTDARALVLAVQDSSDPADLIALVDYKKYSSPSPTDQTSPDK